MMITFLNKLEWSLLKNDTGEHLSFFQGQNLLFERYNKGSDERPKMPVSKILWTTRPVPRIPWKH